MERQDGGLPSFKSVSSLVSVDQGDMRIELLNSWMKVGHPHDVSTDNTWLTNNSSNAESDKWTGRKYERCAAVSASALDRRVAHGEGQIAGNYFMANGRVMHLRIINSAMERICADPITTLCLRSDQFPPPSAWLVTTPSLTLLRISLMICPKFPLFQILILSLSSSRWWFVRVFLCLK